ncbi:MAG: glycosyltransferase family 4 protein [Bacteroidetes bacterium]|nr:glycosyltransferase family 4 protein [Bacteroidota bacterium]
MRILVVTQYFWPENFRINDLVIGLKERGHEVTVFTGKPNYPGGKFFDGYNFFNKRTETWNGIKIIRSSLLPRGKGGGVRLFLNFLSFAFFSSLRAFLLNTKPDVIFVYEPSPITVGIPAVILKKRTRAKLVFWVQDLWPQVLVVSGGIKNKRVITAADKLTKWIYRHSNKILVQSNAFTDYLLSQGVTKEKVTYYPNSAEAFYRPVPKHPDYQKYFTSGQNIVFAGNIGESQAFDTLLAAARLVKAKNKSICWTIIGDGRMKDYVSGKVVEYGLQDTFKLIGAFPSTEMPYFFAYADALILSLKKDFIISLTIPSKLQSYMACGKPVIGCLDGEGARIITQSDGGLVAAGEDEQQLSEQVLHFFELNENERAVLGQNALAFYEKEFERERLLSQLLSIING